MTDDMAIFSMLRHKMQYLSQRQAVIANNIANSSTPNFIPQDVKEPDFAKMVQQYDDKLQLRTNSGTHIPSGFKVGFKQFDDPGREMNPNGNAVDLRKEMLKLNATQSDYNATTSLYRKMNQIMRTALDGQP